MTFSLLAAILGRGGAGLKAFDKTGTGGFWNQIRQMLGLGGAIGAGSAMGASVGGGIGTVATLPVQVANNFIGSGVFGYTMIIGERYAFHNDWPKIQKRIDAGEKIENVFPEYAKVFMNMMIDSGVNSAKQMTQVMKDGALDFLTTGDLGLEDTDTIGDPTDAPVDNSVDEEEQIRRDAAAEEIVDDFGETVETLKWQTVVGSGLDRFQLISAIKQYELVVKSFDKAIANLKTNRTAANQTRIERYEKLRQQQLDIMHLYRDALTWVLRNNKKTP